MTSLPLYKYHTRELYTCNAHSVPAESSCSFPSCNSSSTHTHNVPFPFHASAEQSFFQHELRYSNTYCWMHISFAWCDHMSPNAVTKCWKHIQPHCFSQVYRCSLHGNRLLLSQTLLSLYDFSNRKLHCESYEKETQRRPK